ncbi:hypothetical protein ACO0LF_17550 [Undibacterium sp. Di27W]|uniref:hypothetical protein n=1 Tax=Undibacterium sp. Di27W TaxID=3413036 RepID=UPI003BF1B74B
MNEKQKKLFYWQLIWIFFGFFIAAIDIFLFPLPQKLMSVIFFGIWLRYALEGRRIRKQSKIESGLFEPDQELTKPLRVHLSPADLLALFNGMKDADAVRNWFSSELEYFYQEWPRRQGPYFIAIKNAEKSVHGLELEKYLTHLQSAWYAHEDKV